LYSLDASTIDLCLSVFPWADFRTTKGAVKLHVLDEVNVSQQLAELDLPDDALILVLRLNQPSVYFTKSFGVALISAGVFGAAN